MSTQAGKTAPKLIQDLLTYDPRYEDRAGRNLLASSPPQWDPDSPPTRAVPSRNCRHIFMIKYEQSKAPEGERLSHGDVYKIATYCQSCRWHVDVIVDQRDDGSKTARCSQDSGEYTLHHFIFDGEETEKTSALGNTNVPRRFRFHCSAPKCPVDLRIHMRPPRLNDHYITLLTNKALLRRRLEKARELGGDRADAQMARPIDGPDFLSTYLSDSMRPQKGKARIPLLNRKFLKTFGKDCSELLEYLGFTYEVEIADDGTEVEAFYLPRPPPASDPLDHDTQRTIIEDAQVELGALILSWPEAERSGVRHPLIPPQPAFKLIERVLDCEDYKKKPLVGTRSASHEEDHPYYAGLGAVGDFADSLLLFAYTRQVVTDPAESTYYFECLQDLAVGRKSEILNTQVAILASRGASNRKDVANAYRFIGMDPGHAHVLADEHIIGQFKSRLQDIGPAAVEESRNALRIIGNARNSDGIRQVASNAIETYEQALGWLALEDSALDEYITAMYGMKVADNPSDIEIARKAVEIIAEHRNSEALKKFLDTGELGNSAEMDVGEAYALLGISDRTASLDLDTLRMQVEAFSADKPDNKDRYEKAYSVICKDQQNNKSSFSGLPKKTYPLETWPVGCLNIGNTCYLNSVLQFLFTIKPLREIVLECDQHFQDVTPEALKEKKVGRSEVTVEKVERAQQFVHELRNLFQRMITANTDCIRPETKLAALALTRQGVAVAELTPTTNSPDDPGLGQLNGLPVAGPMPPPQGTSEVTPSSLVDSGMGSDSKSDTSSTVAELDPDDNHQMDLSGSTQEEKLGESSNPVDGSKPEPPSRPPPVPPRPQDIKKIEGLAEQQDAAEILNNVFDLLSCAFKGDGTLRDGEQDDLIKRLFFNDVTAVLNSNGKVTLKTDLQDNYLVSPGERSRPLYAALDDEFSLKEIEGDSTKTKWEFISHVAPIQIFNVRRLVFDSKEKRSRKDESHVGLDDVLYLDRYMEQTKSMSRDELLRLREGQWQLQRILKALESRKAELKETDIKADLSDALDETAAFIEGVNKTNDENLIDVDDDPIPALLALPDDLREKARELEKETELLDGRMKDIDEQIATIFQDCKDHPYRLHAVFMHRGSSTGGHYWIYIYDSQNKIWRNYNDERVEEAEVKHVFEQEGRATSTGVVFVQEDRVAELTEAVHRKPDLPAEPESNDVDMKDADSNDLQIIDGIEKE